MRIRQAVPTLVLLAAACTHNTPRAEMAPRLGPQGTIRALYDGGLLRRRVSAQFSLNEPGYVLVGHLGGDGLISVMYPRRAYPMWAEKGQIYRTAAIPADYDAAPDYYFMALTRQRSPGARSYSYDGRGNGFIFMITSRRPLRLERISDYGSWDDIEVVDYYRMLDPRMAIREYADMLADGAPYTISYAQSFTAYSYTNYADAAMDCAMFSMFTGPWTYGYGWMSGFGYRYGSIFDAGNYCGNSAYAYGYGYRYPYGYRPNGPVFNTPVPQPPVTPVAQSTPRPTFTPTIPTERRTPPRRGDAAGSVTTPSNRPTFTPTPTERRTAPRRGDVLSYRPTWAENPSFAPVPAERPVIRGIDRRPFTADSPQRDWPSRREHTGTTTTTTPTNSSPSSPAPAAAPAPSAPAPTMSPAHGGASEPSRRPPAQ